MGLFTPWVGRAFDSFVVPRLGLIFLPLTTALYLLVSPGGLSGFDRLLLSAGVVMDLGAYGGGAYGRRRRQP